MCARFSYAQVVLHPFCSPISFPFPLSILLPIKLKQRNTQKPLTQDQQYSNNIIMTLQEKSVLDDCTDSHPTVVDSDPVGDSSTSSSTIVDNDGQQPNTEPPIDITKSVPDEEKHLVREAGQGGAALGLLFGGPIGSALLGFGSAYAVRKDDRLGDTARGLAELTISVKEKASTVEEKHQFYKRSKTAIDKACDDKNEKSIAFKTRAFVVSSWLAASTFAKEKQLVEKGVEGTGRGIEYIGGAISSLRSSKSATTNNKNDTTTFASDDEAQETTAVVELQLNSKESNDEYAKLVDATTN